MAHEMTNRSDRFDTTHGQAAEDWPTRTASPRASATPSAAEPAVAWPRNGGDSAYATGPYASLCLDNQLCFPLYAAAKEVVRRYKPLLDRLDLTYTQYIAMMVMWERREINVRDLGARLYLDSGTLTPLLKKLEAKGYVERHRTERDGREILITLTDTGLALRDQALSVPREMASCVQIPLGDATELRRILDELLAALG